VEPVHFLQIWIVPGRRGLPPAYGQRKVDQEAEVLVFDLA
jgi:redox-sensitive bicupin YhaK (pirin superfamily)